ncbi:ABC-type transport system, involved in lipoprotein release, permease component [Hyella patelloides LEGE 07179]|uniref:ABC-type transport system, involved in lipoprotein release, permease component n=1 Tax=Hyella patelloides LEGE 07179 TaxID=945734 RepID=A0A563VVH5_9CYAN|nr:ABC-type transport system, involved in lipoprotein release, permease component [Hyella patelloides LEGE 07179]
MNSLDRKLFRDLWHTRGQVIAIALVVACGIASFVMATSTYTSLILTQNTYYNEYHFAQVFLSLKRAPETIEAQIADIPGVAQTQTRIVVDVTLDVPGLTEPATGRLISVPEQQISMLNEPFIREGRYIESGRGDEVLVSEAFAEANQLQLGDSIGAIINGKWERLKIVGIALSPEYVYEVRGAGELYPDNKRFGIIWMGRDALGEAYDLDGAFNNVTLSLSPGAKEIEVITQLDRLLERYGSLGAYGREDQFSHQILDDEIKGLEIMATILPSIFLGIAAFLLNVVLSRLVSTQREQIAVLKAFGYDNWAIGVHYLKFVLIIVTFGSILGILVGLWLGRGLTQLYTEFFKFPLLRYDFSPRVLAIAIIVSYSAAAIGAFMAVSKAVALPPAQGMRPEPPAKFKPTIIERLGLQRFFSVAGRIILRNLERKPIQAGLSICGISLAVAILITGNYILDAVNYLMDFQFRQVQREDMTIIFNEPRPSRTRYEVANLPGVIDSEPFRLVSARLRFEHRTYRTALTGIQPQGEFRRLMDKNLHSVNLPSDGAILTTKLADILGVKPGDILTVEVLEESRPVRQVTVAGLVDELLGVQAYIDIHALNRLMREGATISGAYLSVDSHLANQLYTELKQIPAVTGISTREASLNSFQETSAENLKMMTNFLVVFACIITFSVVYNSARIALSERGRELASLRIMGFTKAEVAFILLGEQAILTLLAIPFGYLIGYGLAALMSAAFNSELYRLPLIITNYNYAFTFIMVAIAGLISGFIIRRQINRLDLIAVLKTRE